ncbi:MAG: 4Fe-4S dicluster domain-containing protein [Thermoguttaceae bacterium]
MSFRHNLPEAGLFPIYRYNAMQLEQELRNKAKELLTDKAVSVVIGYGLTETGEVGAVFVTDPANVDKLVWDNRCTTNLAVYLKRKEVKALGKPAVVVKGCDARTLAVLEVEQQLNRDNVVIIGVVCKGVLIDPTGKTGNNQLAAKCGHCFVHFPPHCDYVIGEDEVSEEEKNKSQASVEERYKKLEMLKSMSREERLNYWKNEFSRCFKCYACRQVCPLCYCEVCVADKNRPTRLDTSATMKGNFAWHITRAFHLAGRCVGCENCSSACPAGIDLDLLNLSLAKTAEEQFDYKAGMDRETLPLVGTFSQEDKEEFIR